MWAQIDVDDAAPHGYRILYHQTAFNTHDEALTSLRLFVEQYSSLDEPHAMAARQLREGRMQHGTVGGKGRHWVLRQGSGLLRLSLADSRGQVRTVTVRFEPSEQADPQAGHTAPTGSAPGGRIGPGDVPDVPDLPRAKGCLMGLEALLCGLCYAVGLLLTIGGIRSWLDSSRWEMGRILFLPAIVVLIGAHFWGKSIGARLTAHQARMNRHGGNPS